MYGTSYVGATQWLAAKIGRALAGRDSPRRYGVGLSRRLGLAGRSVRAGIQSLLDDGVTHLREIGPTWRSVSTFMKKTWMS